uniref:Uncharacterized protein n=1 Tax=Panagrolaimus sp. JU765 TaxID=591449 RepID=A0AC34QCR0_9BILA
MRGLLASSAALAVLLALFCHATAEFPEILPGDSEHTIGVKKALQKMDLKKLAEKMQKSDESAAKTKLEPPNHGLVSNAASGFGSPFCEPGFTGGNCEY